MENKNQIVNFIIEGKKKVDLKHWLGKTQRDVSAVEVTIKGKPANVWVSNKFIHETQTGKLSVGIRPYDFYEVVGSEHLGLKGFNLIEDYFAAKK